AAEDRPRRKPGGAGPVQRGRRRFSRARRSGLLDAPRRAHARRACVQPGKVTGAWEPRASHFIIGPQPRAATMLRWAVIFLIIAIIAGIFGFTGVAEASASIAKVLFGIFLVLF